MVTCSIFCMTPSWMILTAFLRPRAKASMAAIWAMNKSSRSVDSLRTLASKFSPPGCRPPCSITAWGFHQKSVFLQAYIIWNLLPATITITEYTVKPMESMEWKQVIFGWWIISQHGTDLVSRVTSSIQRVQIFFQAQFVGHPLTQGQRDLWAKVDAWGCLFWPVRKLPKLHLLTRTRR